VVDDNALESLKERSAAHKPIAEGVRGPTIAPVSLPVPITTPKHRTSRSSPNVSPRTIPRYDSERRLSREGQISSTRSSASGRSDPPQVYHNCRGCTFPFELRHNFDANDRRCPDCTALDEEMATTYHWRGRDDEHSSCKFGASIENGIGAACGG
jgi:hypothetical protein